MGTLSSRFRGNDIPGAKDVMETNDRANPFASTARASAGKARGQHPLFCARIARRRSPVGPRSVIDAIEAVEAAGIGTRQDFYATLHAVFVKKHEHTIVFDQAFNIFWRKRGFMEKLIAMMSPQAVDHQRAEEAGSGPRAWRMRSTRTVGRKAEGTGGGRRALHHVGRLRSAADQRISRR